MNRPLHVEWLIKNVGKIKRRTRGGFLGLSSEIDAQEAEFLKKLKKALLED